MTRLDISDVAVVVVGWGNEGLTRACVGHLRARWPDVLVIAVKSGGSSALLSEANVTLCAPNLGYAGGNNLGIRAALRRGARFLVVANSDTFPQPGALERMRHFLLTNPTVGVVGAKLRSWDKFGREEVDVGRRFDWKTGRVCAVSKHDPLDYPGGALLMFRAAALEQVGGFDARLFLFGEEIDWCERARSAGFQAAVEPSAEAIHLGSATAINALKASAFFVFRNNIIVRRRYAAAHGVKVRTGREILSGARVLAGHAYHRRFRLMWPIILALREGLGPLPPVDDDPEAAIAQQVWETRDCVKWTRR